jgi:hypothetical protein
MNLSPNQADAFALAVKHKVAGMGWRMNDSRPIQPVSWAEYTKGASAHYQRGEWKRSVRPFWGDMAVDDLVWAYNKKERTFYLGRITGAWEYTQNQELFDADLCNVRACEWLKVPRDLVPGSMMHGRDTLKQAPGLTPYSKHIYNLLSVSEHYAPDVDQGSFWRYLSPDECEDAVALYLQKGLGFLVQPSTAKHSTPDIEFLMVHGETGELAGVQVKSGKSIVDREAVSGLDMKIYAFSVQDPGTKSASDRVIDLSPPEVEAFLRSNLNALPKTIKHWLQHTKASNKPIYI